MLVLETVEGKCVTGNLLQKRFSDQVFYVLCYLTLFYLSGKQVA